MTSKTDLQQLALEISNSPACQEGVKFIASRVIYFKVNKKEFRVIEGRHVDNDGKKLTHGLECFWLPINISF